MEELLNIDIVQKLNEEFQKQEQLKDENFEIVNCIGAGAFGKVFKIQSKNTNKFYAKKLFSVNAIIRQDLQKILKNEILLLAHCNHKNIIKILAIYQEDETFNIILEYFDGQNLFQMLKKQKSFTENATKKIIYEITKGLFYLHSQLPPILHRDLKSENILYKDGIIKIIDFGWSNKYDEYRNTFCGTPDYFCPEMINGTGHDEKLDIWSLGILTYELIHGRPPFTPTEHDLNRRQLQRQVEQNILKGNINFQEQISQQSKQFILWLLQQTPQDRPEAFDILENDYLKDQREKDKSFDCQNTYKESISELNKKIKSLEKKNQFYKQKLDTAQKLLVKQKSKIKNLQKNKIKKQKTQEDFAEEDCEKTLQFSFFRSKTQICQDNQNDTQSKRYLNYEDMYVNLKNKIDEVYLKNYENMVDFEMSEQQKVMYQLDKILDIKQNKKSKKPPAKKTSNISNLKHSSSKKFLSKKSDNKLQSKYSKLFISDFTVSDNKLIQKMNSYYQQSIKQIHNFYYNNDLQIFNYLLPN